MEISRRQALIAAGTAGLAALAPALPGTPAQASALRSGSTRSARDFVILRLFNSDAFNGQLSFCLGGASSHTAELGEVLYLVNEVNAKTGDPDDDHATATDFETLVQACVDLGDRLEGLARGVRRSDPVSYRQRMMRASSYMAQSLFFVLGGTEPGNEAEYFRICQDRWLRSARAFDRPVETFEVASPFGEIPCYFFAGGPDGQRRPTVIVSSGSDGQLVECMEFGVTDGLARGYNVVLFEGPGQMSLLFEEQIPFTPRWDQVVGPIVEELRRRNDVGPIALVGISFGGMLSSSAAAELDLDATVLMPGAWNMTLIWSDQEDMNLVKHTHALPPKDKAEAERGLNQGFAQGAWEQLPRTIQWDFYKRGEIFSPRVLREARAGKPVGDYYGLLEAMLPFDFRHQFQSITSPVMVTRNQGDQFFNGGGGDPPTPTTGEFDQPAYAFGLLEKVPRRHKRFVDFSMGQGASLHDQPLAPQFANEVMFDWLGEVLPPTG